MGADSPNPAAEVAPSTPAPLPPAMRLAHTAWVIAAVLAILIVIASLPGYAVWLSGQNPVVPDALPYSVFNVLSGLTSLVTVSICLGLALLLFVRKRNEPMALFVSFYLMAYGITLAGPIEFLTPVVPGTVGPAQSYVQPFFLIVPTVALLVLFPDGRPVPPRSRWLILAGIAISAAYLLPAEAPFVDYSSLPTRLAVVALAVVLLLGFWAQLYRYRHVSTAAERQQTRWVVVGLVLWMALAAMTALPWGYLQSLPPGMPRPGWAAVMGSVWWLSLAVLPITLTIAILRYRLYDVDLLINRALVYGALTAILAGLYSASITLFQKLFVALTGQQSDAAVVLTTLLLVSAFTPIHTRLKAVVERRYRDVHDPSRLLAEFSARLDGGLWVVNPRSALSRLLVESADAFDAANGAANLRVGATETQIATVGEWQGRASLSAPVMLNGETIGRLALGPRRNNVAYTPEDTAALCAAAEAVARALQ